MTPVSGARRGRCPGRKWREGKAARAPPRAGALTTPGLRGRVGAAEGRVRSGARRAALLPWCYPKGKGLRGSRSHTGGALHGPVDGRGGSGHASAAQGVWSGPRARRRDVCGPKGKEARGRRSPPGRLLRATRFMSYGSKRISAPWGPRGHEARTAQRDLYQPLPGDALVE